MTEDREKISTGPNEEPTDEEVEEAARAFRAPAARKERDTLPLEGE